MKVLQVIQFFPKHGFYSRLLMSLQNAKHGHDVTIITTTFEFDPKDSL